jgi:hypothetical protein
MKMSRWSDYERYIVMVDGGKKYKTVQGINMGHEAFLEFKLVKEVLIKISNGSKNYSYNGKIYKSSITQSKSTLILEGIKNCKWNNDIRKIANQIGAASKFLSPLGKK